MFESLQVFNHAQVRRIRLNRPAVHNAFDAQLIQELTQALTDAGQAGEVRVVVLEGEGPSFSAGANANWMRSLAAAGEAENQRDALALAGLMRTLDRLPKPTIARVHGSAFGGGVGLIACCDIAIGATEAKFGLTESKLGLLPATISPYVIAAIGTRHARRYFASSEIFDAAQARHIGLLHEVVPAEQLDAVVQRQIELLLKAGPVAVSLSKQLVHDVVTATDRAALEQANAALIARLRVSAEGQEGLSAFLDKRKPTWIGND